MGPLDALAGDVALASALVPGNASPVNRHSPDSDISRDGIDSRYFFRVEGKISVARFMVCYWPATRRDEAVAIGVHVCAA